MKEQATPRTDEKGAGKTHEKHRMNAQTFAGLFRLIKLLFSFYPVQLSFIGICIVIFSIATALPAVCMQQAIQVVSEHFVEGNWAAAAHASRRLPSCLRAFMSPPLLRRLFARSSSPR